MTARVFSHTQDIDCERPSHRTTAALAAVLLDFHPHLVGEIGRYLGSYERVGVALFVLLRDRDGRYAAGHVSQCLCALGGASLCLHYGSRLGTGGPAVLARLLGAMAALTSLDLSENDLIEDGAAALQPPA